MKKLILMSVMGLAACSQSQGVHTDWVEGARFGPSTRAEFSARAERGEPGVFPAPSGYSNYASKQIDDGTGTRVVRQGTASSRTGEYSGPGRVANAAGPAHSHSGSITHNGTTYTKENIPDWALPPGVKRSDVRVASADSTRNSPYRANALVAAKEAKGKGQEINLAGQRLDVYHIDVGSSSYAVFRKRSGIGGGSFRLDASLGSEMVAALPSLTGCNSVAGPFKVGPNGRSNTHMVYALNC